MPIVQVSGCPYFTLTVVRALSPFILHHFSVGLVSRYQFILVSLLFVFREFTFSLILTTIRPWLDSPDLRKWKFSLHKETSLTSFVTSKQSFKCSTEHLFFWSWSLNDFLLIFNPYMKKRVEMVTCLEFNPIWRREGWSKRKQMRILSKVFKPKSSFPSWPNG